MTPTWEKVTLLPSKQSGDKLIIASLFFKIVARGPPIEINAGEKYPHTRTEKQERKQTTIIFNEVQQFAYVLGVREREI